MTDAVTIACVIAGCFGAGCLLAALTSPRRRQRPPKRQPRPPTEF